MKTLEQLICNPAEIKINGKHTKLGIDKLRIGYRLYEHISIFNKTIKKNKYYISKDKVSSAFRSRYSELIDRGVKYYLK